MNAIEKAYHEGLAREFSQWCGESDINLDDFLDYWQKQMIIDWWIAKLQKSVEGVR